jgi:mersacidin/lichenicidin family type 2 lantibiotic
MSKADVIRAWKDPDYRGGLSVSDLAMLPANPAGRIEVSDDDLNGLESNRHTTAVTCTCTGTRQCTVDCAW